VANVTGRWWVWDGASIPPGAQTGDFLLDVNNGRVMVNLAGSVWTPAGSLFGAFAGAPAPGWRSIAHLDMSTGVVYTRPTAADPWTICGRLMPQQPTYADLKGA